MKKAVFYLLQDQQQKARYLCACRLAAKAYTNKLKVYIYTSSVEESNDINTLLWTFNDISFVPHKIYHTPNTAIDANNLTEKTPAPPVLIGNIEPPASHHDVLINLTPTFPSFIADFCHIIEIIPNEENWRSTARTHYKKYQAAGYENITHNLD